MQIFPLLVARLAGKVCLRAIASVKSFHNLDTVTSCHVNTFQGLRSYQVRFFKMSSFPYKDALL